MKLYYFRGGGLGYHSWHCHILAKNKEKAKVMLLEEVKKKWNFDPDRFKIEIEDEIEKIKEMIITLDDGECC